MFKTLIDVDTEGNVLLNDKRLVLIPKLFEVYKTKYMGSNMIKWIVSMDDYRSPYRKLPPDEREEMVTSIYFGQEKKTLCHDPLVKDARREYNKLQYDPLIDQYNAMSEQMAKMNKVYRDLVPDKDNIEDINKIQIEMGKAAEAREKIKRLILKDQEDEVKISGAHSDDLSLMEQDQIMREK